MTSKYPTHMVVDHRTYDLASPDGRVKLAELKKAAVRLKVYGASLDTIADKLGLDYDMAANVVEWALRETVADDVALVRARQQVIVNDIRKAMYPVMESLAEETRDRVSAVGAIIKATEFEAKIHGTMAPTKVAVGMDGHTFTTTVAEDMKTLGIDPRQDTAIDEGDDGWANT